MELKLIYQLLAIKAKELMKKGDLKSYLITLERMNELKLELAK
ncbi:MAG: hypothetical protein ACLGGV_03735 [Bacteroidia bacterium]